MLLAGLHPGYIVVSLVAYLVFLLVSSVPDVLGSRLVTDTPLQGTGWDPWFQLSSLLVPVAVAPLVIMALQARGQGVSRAANLVPVGMLIVFAGGLWIPARLGQGPAMGLPGYFVAVAAGLTSILFVRSVGQRLNGCRTGRVAWSSGPGWLLVGGALAYGLLAVGVLAWPAVAVGLVCLVTGAVWGRGGDRLHPSPSVRRVVVGGGVGILSLFLLPTAVVGWCLSAPLIYLLSPPAVLALVVLSVPAEGRLGGGDRALVWTGGVGAALCLLAVIGGVAGVGSLALCS